MAKNILVVDDAAFMRMMIKDILTKNGYNVAGEAENGAKAVEKYNELHPDLVLMDIGSHFGVPPAGLVTKMHTGFQELLHRYDACHGSYFLQYF